MVTVCTHGVHTCDGPVASNGSVVYRSRQAPPIKVDPPWKSTLPESHLCDSLWAFSVDLFKSPNTESYLFGFFPKKVPLEALES